MKTRRCRYRASNGSPLPCPCGKRYMPTRKNKNTLRRWKRGESIGFTLTSSLKAKGLIPRTSKSMRGKKVVSDKYC